MNNKRLKSLLIILGVATVIFAGYYLLSQQSSVSMELDSPDPQYQAMLMSTKDFIQRRQQLSKTNLDVRFFENDNFTSLRAYSAPLKEIEAGRADPFAQVQNF